MSAETGLPDIQGLPVTELSQQQQQQDGEEEVHAAELFSRLQSQVEFYFSQPNLARDDYLRNMLTSEHPDMPSPRPAQFMCPVGIVTSFPKVQNICSQFGEPTEPPALLLGKALEGSNIAYVSSDGNWIGPALQQLPPPMMGLPPPRAPNHQQQPHYQQGPYPPNQFQQGAYSPNLHQQRMSMPPLPMRQGEGGVAMQYQPSLPYPSPGQHPNSAPISLVGSESPSSASIESMPPQQQAHQAASADKDAVYIAVMDLPSEVNPIEILSAFTSELIRPKHAFVNGSTGVWFVAFSSESDAKGAIQASRESMIGGMPVRAKLNSLPASSKVSAASASAASLSSMSAPGGQMSHQQQPVPLMAPGGPYALPPGPSPPPPMVTQNMMPGPYPGGPQYGMLPQMQPQFSGMPPGQPYMQPYYNPQQMQQVYPGSYMQPQPHQMGNRYGMPPPLPRGYPGGPPPPYPQYQGMPQYMGEGYGHYQHHGHPPPHRQYNDRRPGGPGSGPAAGASAGGGFHDQKKRNDGTNKKKKNKNHQQQGRRESYGSGSTDNNGQQRRNDEHSNSGHNNSRNDNSTSPVPSKWKSKQEHAGQFRRSQGNASPASFNRYSNRHHRNDRLGSSDTTPSPPSRRQGKADDKEIFDSSDFPGLGGGENDEKSEKTLNHNLVGYASALLKKKEAENKKEVDNVAATVATDNEVDSITRQTEEMEREILSEFHDLSLIGDGNNNDVASSSPGKNQQGSHHSSEVDDTAEGQTVGTASTSTIDAPSPPNTPLPILPGPFPDNDSSIFPDFSSASPKQQQQPPAIDVTNPQDFPSPESANVDVAEPPSLPEVQTAPDIVEDPKPPGVWGGKRFADVI